MNRGARLPLKEPGKIWNEMTVDEREKRKRWTWRISGGRVRQRTKQTRFCPFGKHTLGQPPFTSHTLAIPSSETSQQITKTLRVNNCSPRVPFLATLLYVSAGHRHRILTHLRALFGCTSFLVKVCMCKLEHSLCGSLFPPGAAPDHVCLTFSTSTCLHLLSWEVPCCRCTSLVSHSVSSVSGAMPENFGHPAEQQHSFYEWGGQLCHHRNATTKKKSNDGGTQPEKQKGTLQTFKWFLLLL